MKTRRREILSRAAAFSSPHVERNQLPYAAIVSRVLRSQVKPAVGASDRFRGRASGAPSPG